MLEEMIHKLPPVNRFTHLSMFKYINEGSISSFEPSQTELPGCNTEGKIHPEDKNNTREAITKMLRGVSSPPCEFRLIQPDSSLRYISLMVRKVQDRRRQ